MAELSSRPSPLPGTPPLAPPISVRYPAWEQLRAIAWLRWRIAANSFRRKGGAGELIARILVMPLLLAAALLPVALAGAAAYYLASIRELPHVAWILWFAFGLTQLLNINLGQPGTTFDPIELIRFPIPLRRFVLIRLCFGVLSPANIVVSLISLAVVAGIAVADRRLLLPAAMAMALFALTNILFTRMVFAWVDRWLSTRRARELFTAFIFLASLSFQYLNVRFNPGFQHSGSPHSVQHRTPPAAALRRVEHNLSWAPPELTAQAIAAAAGNKPALFLANLSGNAVFVLVFLAVYTLRMRTEYHGEALSDAANAVRSEPKRQPPSATTHPSLTSVASVEAPISRWPVPSLLPLLAKELLVLRRNVGLFYGLVAPAVMVFLFAGRVAAGSGPHWVLFGAVGYALLGISPLSYNSFGMEGTGAQLYFFAPIRLREVFVAKNVFALLIAFTEILVVVAVTGYVAGRPRVLDLTVALLWATGALLINTTIGNLRSVSAPKRVNPGRTMGKAQSAVSSYIALGVLAGCAGLGLGVELLATYLHQPWLPLVFTLVFALAGAVVYTSGLRGIETYTMERRDTLFEELGKKI